jgi:hypothetical protein
MNNFENIHLVAAINNIQRIENICSLQPQQRKVFAVLAEELKLYNTAAKMWKSIGNDLDMARVYAKMGKETEALLILAKFENCENNRNG